MDLVKQLPEEIVIYHILPRLGYTSWVRAACVCWAWRDLCRLVVPPPPEIPWLWYSHPEYKHSFLCLPSTFTSPLRPCPLVPNVWVGDARASYRQYLLCFDPSPSYVPRGTRLNVIIYNPFTGNTLPLPTPPRRARLDVAALARLRLDSDSFIFVAAMVDVAGTVHTCDLGSHKWASTYNMGRISDLIFHGGLLYSISSDREIRALDVFKHPVKRPWVVVPIRQYTPVSRLLYGKRHPNFSYYLVESSCKELLVVTRYNFVRASLRCPLFTVHRVDEVAGKLVQVHDLGDQMLFLGRGCSRSSTWYGSHAWQSDFFTKNSIYFYERDEQLSHFSLGKFSLGESGSWNAVMFHPEQVPISFRPIWITHVPR